LNKINYQQLDVEHFAGVIALGNQVHGDNYLNLQSLQLLYSAGIQNGINASWVALSDQQVVGFRLTISAGNWTIDKWCTPEKWGIAIPHVCYFKCNTVNEDYRALGIGSKLLALSIEQVKKQGGLAGLAHIWLASPKNSAFRYFSKCGGVTVKEHPGKWRELSIHNGYECPVCPAICECVAAEMILKFNE
jgi:ribosomal protein S18 acetylase RimI-like enzyme